MVKPFRWTVAKREQLGRLIEGQRAVARRDWPAFLADVRRASARILALADDADLAFIGRTPENLYDYLSGAFAGVDDAPHLHLVQYSMRWADGDVVSALAPEQIDGLFSYFEVEGIDALRLQTRPRPLALVDFVAHGGTMEGFVRLLREQAARQGADWNVIQRRLKIIGLRVQEQSSPKTWRWQQHQDWLDLIPKTRIRNVSAPAGFLLFLANVEPKTTRSFHAGRWADVEERAGGAPGEVSEETMTALRLAADLYDAGRTREERLALAALLSEKPQMKQAATRALVLRLRGK